MRASAPVVLVIFDELPVHSLMAADGRIDKRLYPNFARPATPPGTATRPRSTRTRPTPCPHPRRAAAAPGPAAGGGGPPRERLQPVRRAYSARERGRDRAVRAEPVQGRQPAGLQPPHALAVGRPQPRLRPRGAARRPGARAALGHRDLGRLQRRARHRLGGGRHRVVKRETKRQRYVRIHQNLAQGRPGALRGVRRRDRGRADAAPAPDPHPAAARAVPVPAGGASTGARPRKRSPDWTGGPGTAARSWSSRPISATCSSSRPPTGCSASCSTACTRSASTTAPWSGVVADHGMSFRLGHDRRLVRAENVQDLAPVPFFLKAPGQKRGRISDRRLQTVDVLPTIADTLGVDIPWKVDGRSALAPPGSRGAARSSPRSSSTPTWSTPRATRAPSEPRWGARSELFGGDIYAFGPRPDLGSAASAPGGGDRWVVDPGSGIRGPRGRDDPGRPARRRAHGGGGGERPRGRHRGDVHARGRRRGAVLDDRAGAGLQGARNRIQLLLVEGRWKPSAAPPPPRPPPRSAGPVRAASRAAHAG